VVNAIWDYWNLDDVFNPSGKKYVDTSTIARILSINGNVALSKYTNITIGYIF
jgi:hypothetical protein